MKYSVIIPVYNAEEKLDRCLESIITQDYHDYEIVLVNDGSVDKSGEICKKYSDEYGFVKYIEKENGGASSARNAGIDNAEGEYILFVDSDDYVKENYFSVINSYECNNGLLVFTYDILTKSSTKTRPISDSLLSDRTSRIDKCKELILSRTINSPCAKVFNKKLIDSVELRFDEKMPVAEDFNFCLAYLMKSESIMVINESIYCYDMTNETSLVHKRKEGLIDIYPYVFDTAYASILNSDFSKSEKEQLFRIWDKLHTDSFITCVIEEIKDENATPSEIKRRIKIMCKKFYDEYKPDYGYENFVHFFVRFCIKHKLCNVLYYSSYAYLKYRG